jgi:hypothetical protein
MLRQYYADALAGKCGGSGCFATLPEGWTCDSPTAVDAAVAVQCYQIKKPRHWIYYGWIPYGAGHP